MKITLTLFSLLIISVIFVPGVYGQESDVLKLVPSDDAYVVANLNDPSNTSLQMLNTGDMEFLKIWYANNVTKINELVITVGHLKFDLSDLNPDKISSVNLRMYSSQVDLQTPTPVLNLYTIEDNSWSESELIYTNKPEFSEAPIAHAVITEADKWYSWDITDYVKENAGSEISLAMVFDLLYGEHEEQVIFHSKETNETGLVPVLEIKYASAASSETAEGGGCLIATAAYGSELAPQVQQLRELRDNIVLSTESGAAFMESFNSLYYSFSPTIADLERQNPAFKETVKLAITPLVSSLAILNYLDIDSEEKMLGYGIGIILLNIGMYFVAPALVIYRLRWQKNYKA